MPTIETPTGATIHYEVIGRGFPVLLLAPGGLNSAIGNWASYPYNPIVDLFDEFQLIAMDQRNAGTSYAPLEAAGWAEHAADQLMVLDALGIERCSAIGGCIGSSYCFRLIHDAPDRILGAVALNPIGRDGDNFGVFRESFERAAAFAEANGMGAVVEAARRNPSGGPHPEGGPWANRIAADPAFAATVGAMPVAEYAALLRRYAGTMFDGDFVFSVDEAWMRTCPRPLAVFAGNDNFHPTAIAERIAALAPNAEYYAAWKGEPETPGRVRSFLRRHRPAG
jgi:pimeloyl-ACP methyl ester carboxylesterase